MIKITTSYWPPPIPERHSDWSAVLKDYEPGEPIGYGMTEDSAVASLIDQLEGKGGYFADPGEHVASDGKPYTITYDKPEES